MTRLQGCKIESRLPNGRRIHFPHKDNHIKFWTLGPANDASNRSTSGSIKGSPQDSINHRRQKEPRHRVSYHHYLLLYLTEWRIQRNLQDKTKWEVGLRYKNPPNPSTGYWVLEEWTNTSQTFTTGTPTHSGLSHNSYLLPQEWTHEEKPASRIYGPQEDSDSASMQSGTYSESQWHRGALTLWLFQNQNLVSSRELWHRGCSPRSGKKSKIYRSEELNLTLLRHNPQDQELLWPSRSWATMTL